MTIQMFNSKGHFVYPPNSAIAALSDLEKIRFEFIRSPMRIAPQSAKVRG